MQYLLVSSVFILLNLTLVLSNQECNSIEQCLATTITVALPNQIFCSAERACKQAILNGQTICNAKNSCESAQITSGGRVECSGENSCKQTVSINAVGDVQCTGPNACFLANIQSAANIYCGAGGCNNAQKMVATNTIYCSGTYGCGSARQVDANEIYANGERSIKWASVSANTIYATGYEAAFEGVIRAGVVNGIGERSLYSSVIYVKNGLSSISVSVTGNNAGERSVLVCNNDETCSINCGGTGCSGPNGAMTINCNSGATCTVTGCNAGDAGCARILSL